MKRRQLILFVLMLSVFLGNANYALARCGGTERWFVKVGTDTDADKVDINNIVPITVEDLNNLPQLRDRVPSGDNKMRLPEERTVYQVKARLVMFKDEDDSDYHLVITDDSLRYTPGGTGTDGLETGTSFIAEIPDPACVAGKKGDLAAPSLFDAQLREVRRKFEEKFPGGAGADTNLGGVPITLTGILFYDRQHHQTGRAVNGVELHPLLDISFEDSSLPTSSSEAGSVRQLLANSGFEEGITGWAGSVNATVGSFEGISAHRGDNLCWLGGLGQSHTETVYQNVSIPSSITKATLSFWLRIDTEETTSSKKNDKLYVQINDDKGNKLKTLKEYSNLDNISNYTQQDFDLTPYAGKAVQIYFKATENSTKATSFFIDDVVVTVQ